MKIANKRRSKEEKTQEGTDKFHFLTPRLPDLLVYVSGTVLDVLRYRR